MALPLPPTPRRRIPLPSEVAAPTGRRRLHGQTLEDLSAGGVLVDDWQAAIIARRNRAGRVEWCLPKGHPEAGETPAQAAQREVAEETGVSGTILGSLGSIDYWFTVGHTRIHKVVHHFLLRAVSGTLSPTNDPDGEVIDVAWVPLANLSDQLSFINEREIAQLAARRWQQ